MAYRLTYFFTVTWVGPGLGPIGSPQVGPGVGNAQALTLLNQAGGQNVAGAGAASGAGTLITSGDITTLTNAAAADMAAQLNQAANFNKINGWPTGNP